MTDRKPQQVKLVIKGSYGYLVCPVCDQNALASEYVGRHSTIQADSEGVWVVCRMSIAAIESLSMSRHKAYCANQGG